MDCVYKEIVEIRTRITELLVTCQSDISMRDEGTLDSSLGFQAIINDEPQAIVPLAFNKINAVSPLMTPQELSNSEESLAFRGQLTDLECGPLGLTSTLQEGVGCA